MIQKQWIIGVLTALVCVQAAAQNAGRVAFGADGAIYTANVDGTGRELLLDTGATPNSVVWSPDGTWIAYALSVSGQYELFIYDVAGGDVRQITHNNANDLQPAWSPDGTRLAYASNRMGDYDVWVVDADCADADTCAESAVKLTTTTADDRSPSWSPDGESIAFVSSREQESDTQHSVYVMDADGEPLRRVTSEPDQDTASVAWSPDGAWLAYRSGGVDDIGTVEIIDTGGGQRRVLARGDIGYTLAWSPDGAQIIYGCWRGHYYHMCVIDADCGDTIAACTERRAIYDFGDVTLFSWHP